MDAREMHRKLIESSYDGFCSIYEYEKKKDEKSKLTKGVEVLVSEDIPCRLSFSSIPTASGDGTTVSRQQTVKLFLAPEVPVKAGSKIVVTQNGVTKAYKGSSEPAIYTSHQEINLELFKEWT